jgi:hypothetical protein
VALSFSGSPLRPFAEVAGGDVRAVVSDGAGGWYIGGTFTDVGGQPHRGLAHIDANRNVDPAFNAGITATDGLPSVESLALSSSAPDAGTLYVGGRFDRIGTGDGQPHLNIAALDGATGEAKSAVAIGTACKDPSTCSPAVRSMSLAHIDLDVEGKPSPQPVLFFAGDFDHAGFGAAKEVFGVAAIWGIGAKKSTGASNAGVLVIDTSSTPWGFSFSRGAVRAVQADGGAAASAGSPVPVYLAGRGPSGPFLIAYQFAAASPTSREAATATQYSTWDPRPGAASCSSCAVEALTLDRATTPATLYFGGSFSTVGAAATPTGNLARVPVITDVATTFGPTAAPTAMTPGVAGSVTGLAVAPAGLLAAGGFQAGASLIDASGGAVSTWSPPPADGVVTSVAADASSAYVGGAFQSLGAQPRDGAAAFDDAGVLDESWRPTVALGSGPGRVHALTVAGGSVFLGGQFDHVGGAARSNLAAVDVSTGSPTPFTGDVGRSPGTPDVLTLAIEGPTLYVGGAFTTLSGQPRSNLGAVDAQSGVAGAWRPDPSDKVEAVEPACGTVYAGGWFSQIGGEPRSYLAALDPGSAHATAWAPEPDGAVFALARSGLTLYAGGNFGGTDRAVSPHLAGLDVSTGRAVPLGAQPDGPVRALLATDSLVLFGGRFSAVGNTPRSNLAGIGSGGEVSTWAPAVGGPVEALATAAAGAYAGGTFGSVSGHAQRGIAGFSGDAGSAPSADCAAAGTGGRDVPQGGGGPAPIAISAPRGALPVRQADVGRLRIAPTRLRLRSLRTLVLRFRLSRALPVRLRVERSVPVPCPRRRTARCTRFVGFAALTGTGARGANRLSFARGRVAGRRLAPGRYRVTLTVAAVRRSGFFTVAR